MGRSESLRVLVATALLSLALGSVHAFSVFIVPLEMRFEASRAWVSLTYSIALVSLTLAVLFGPRIFGRWSAHRFLGGIALLAATGVFLSALAPSLQIVWLSYGVTFGAANGLGYGFGLQLAARAYPGREGHAMGFVTAAYALGATLSPFGFVAALSRGGYAVAMVWLGVVLLAMAPIMFGLLRFGSMRLAFETGPKARHGPPNLPLIWIGYGSGVAAGLMVIGHAAEIARSLGSTLPVWSAPALVAVFNMVGSLACGWLSDRLPLRLLLCGLPLLSVVALGLLAAMPMAALALPALAIAGFSYGGIIAVTPASLSKRFGATESPRIYGRVFTAWGCAGLVAPVTAAALYDAGGSYAPGLAAAAGLGLVSSVAVYLDGLRDDATRLRP